ncbi:MAG: host-nuclease inhibitor Gam family protein [Prosthecobacter sp.]
MTTTTDTPPPTPEPAVKAIPAAEFWRALQEDPPQPSPKEKAKTLLASYATKMAVLREATAPYLTQIAAIQEALGQATTVLECEIENMEAELKRLALEHGEEVFDDDTRSMIESGFILQVRGSTAIVCDDDDAAIAALLNLAETAKSEEARVAARACIRTKHELDREAIGKMIVGSPEWFAIFGIVLAPRESATVKAKPAPKPKAAKKTTKPKGKAADATTEQPTIQEAA